MDRPSYSYLHAVFLSRERFLSACTEANVFLGVFFFLALLLAACVVECKEN